jgi:negative regulator of sigma E activity
MTMRAKWHATAATLTIAAAALGRTITQVHAEPAGFIAPAFSARDNAIMPALATRDEAIMPALATRHEAIMTARIRSAILILAIHRSRRVAANPRGVKPPAIPAPRINRPRFIPATPAPPSPADQDARNLLTKMLEAESDLAFTGLQTTTLYRPRRTVTSQQTVYHDGARSLKMVYVGGPPSVNGEQIVDDGNTFWHYTPSRNTLETGPSRVKRLRNRIRQLIRQINLGSLNVTVTGQDNVAGRACSIVDVRPAAGFGAWRRFWIDPVTGLQIKVEEYRADGGMESSSYFSQIAVVSGFPPNTFSAPATPPTVNKQNVTQPKPQTVAEAQKRVAFIIRQPSYIPGGYRLQSAQVSRFRNQQMVILRYVNSLNTLSIFETPADSPTDSAPATSPRRDVALATVSGMKLVVVGMLGPDDLQRVLASIR